MNLNSVNITGRATKEVELKTTQSGKNVATVSIAVNGMNDEVSYFDVVCWNKTAEIVAQYVNKGKQIAVNGRLQQRRWEDSDGAKRYAVEIVANQVELLGSSDGEKKNKPMTQTQALNGGKDFVLEDIDDTPIDLSTIPFKLVR